MLLQASDHLHMDRRVTLKLVFECYLNGCEGSALPVGFKFEGRRAFERSAVVDFVASTLITLIKVEIFL